MYIHATDVLQMHNCRGSGCFETAKKMPLGDVAALVGTLLPQTMVVMDVCELLYGQQIRR